jgi:hypothetical protein
VPGPVTPTVGGRSTGGISGWIEKEERGGLAVDLRAGWPDGRGFLRKEEGPGGECGWEAKSPVTEN